MSFNGSILDVLVLIYLLIEKRYELNQLLIFKSESKGTAVVSTTSFQ